MTSEDNTKTNRFSMHSTVVGMILVASLAVCPSLLSSLGCSLSPEDRLNPVDPNNPLTRTDPFHVSLNIADVPTDTGVVQRIRVNWWNIEHSQLDEYHVQRRDPNANSLFFTVGVTQRSDTAYIDTSSVSGTPYYYMVLAVFNGGADTVSSSFVSSVQTLPDW